MAKYRIVEHWNSYDDNRYWVVEKKILIWWKVLRNELPGYGLKEDRYYTFGGAERRVEREQKVESSIIIWTSDG